MKKRIIVFFLSVCMIVSLLAQYVPGVSAKEIDPWENPEAYVGSVATFNTTNGEDSLSSFHIIGDPANYDYSVNWEDDAYWLYNEASEQGKDELPDDLMKLIITDCYDHEVEVSDDEGIRNVRYVWYKVEAAEGYELPEKMSDKPYILYMSSDDYDWGCPPALNFDLIEETAKTEETDESSIDTLDVDDEELVGYVVPEGMISPWENPEAYIGSVATFNTTNGEKSLSDFHVFGDPANYDYEKDWLDDTYWLYNESAESGEDELPDDYMQMKIIDCYVHDVATESGDMKFIWYKVEAAEGYELPEKMTDKPYVLYMTTHEYEVGDPVALNFDFIPETAGDGRPELPDGFAIEKVGLKGYFSEDVVKFYKTPAGTARTEDLNTADLPDFVDVLWLVTDNRVTSHETWYYIGNTQSWAGIENWTDCYVPISHVTLVPAEVTELYEALLGSTSVAEYDELMENADSEIVDQLTEKHLANLQEHFDAMVEAETRTEETTVTIGGIEVPVSVTGLLPTGATLSVGQVDNAEVLNGGFDIESAEDIVLALDIKVLDENGDEWQPKEGRQITVAIGMEELGYEDGKIFRLHHKHGDSIDVFEIFVVMDGKLTVVTNGFSAYVVSAVRVTPANNAQPVAINNGTLTLTVGQEIVYYADTNRLNQDNPSLGTWQVLDEEGAIFYEVYTNANVGNGGYYAPWIRIVALKETAAGDGVTLYFAHGNNNQKETYTLNITKPQPDPQKDFDGNRLYIKDDVNERGVITAVLTDAQGNITTLGSDSKFSWVRSDGAYIVPGAYKDNGSSIDICVDHGGLIQRRLDEEGGPTYITYTVTVTLPNGLEKTAKYTVYYQSEILNSSFESPGALSRSYTFFMNGWPKLYWKTTSPGTDGNLTKDVEYAHYDENNRNDVDPKFYPASPAHGRQFAELNAEEYGALYQDIITAPGEDVEWEFYHAKRDDTDNGESMYLIMGPTEYAQKITTYDDLDDLVDAIVAGTTDGERNDTILRRGEMVEFTYTDGATYAVWYHDADVRNTAATAWEFLEDEYVVPPGQYRTRLFFVSNPNRENGEASRSQNYGNLIDGAVVGQYKTYLIEYYEESYATGKMVVTHRSEYDQSGRALIYSSVELKDYDYFIEHEHDFLSKIEINGENYPYNIKYPGVAALFIEKYSLEKKPTGQSSSGKNYADYDIVMRIYLRDTVIAVQKWVEFPTVTVDGETEEALSPLQKQGIIDNLADSKGVKGYYSQFHLECRNAECDSRYDTETIYITKNDPLGWYTGFIPIGDNPVGDHTFSLTEKSIPALPGLELDKVSFTYFYYQNGKRIDDEVRVETFEDVEIKEVTTNGVTTTELVAKDSNGSEVPVILNGITLDEEIKIAEIQVKNVYKEKTVTINYEAVGKGTVKLQDGTSLPTDKATETFRYYSGNPQGAVATPDTNYTFAGWYLDKECTMPVGENHGYVNKTGEFKPNKDLTVSDDQLVVTYYAKFSIGSLQIIRENAEPGQVFVYEIKDENNSVVMYATVVVGANGKGSTEIVDASFGTDQSIGKEYTVTQLNDWSWRHGTTDLSKTQTHKVTTGLHGAMNMTTVFTFDEDATKNYWLNGNSTVEVNRYVGIKGAN